MEPERKCWDAMMRRLDAEMRRELFSAYDVRIILGDLAEKTRTVGNRQELASLLQKHIEGALHPKSFVCYFEADDFQLAAASGAVSTALETIPATLPLLTALTRSGKAWNVSELDRNVEVGSLSVLAPECLVPILGRDGRLIGVLVLGQRISGEPYSGQDADLLESVASQVGIAIESLRMAERMAERMEAERRIQQEMEFAKQVQARLFPQKLPKLNTLEYTGRCIQTRQVGGDHYDFLEMRPGRVALVLADIAGKGLSGALLMANLQANLRSQYAMALEDLRQFLTSVNRLFYENTDESSYATLFFADYDDTTRRLRYVNCGHLPPLLLRTSQRRTSGKPAVERLTATSTVLGLFEDWQGDVAEAHLAPEDILVMYTDGVTEATDGNEEEFGEGRLLETLNEHQDLSAPALLQAVIECVQQFQDGEQADDITLAVARCR